MEQWADVKGYEGIYEVSNLGRVRSLDRTILRGNGILLKHGRVLKPEENSKGYLRVLLCKSGKKERVFVHRLVAEAFVEKPCNYNVVNHLDFNPKNNCASNLEWTTHYKNMRYSFERGRFDRTDAWLNALKKQRDQTESRFWE